MRSTLHFNYLMNIQIYFSNPNSPLPVPVEWPAYNGEEKLYLEISTEPVVRNETEKMREKVHFWHHDFINVVLPPANGEFILKKLHVRVGVK